MAAGKLGERASEPAPPSKRTQRVRCTHSLASRTEPAASGGAFLVRAAAFGRTDGISKGGRRRRRLPACLLARRSRRGRHQNGVAFWRKRASSQLCVCAARAARSSVFLSLARSFVRVLFVVGGGGVVRCVFVCKFRAHTSRWKEVSLAHQSFCCAFCIGERRRLTHARTQSNSQPLLLALVWPASWLPAAGRRRSSSSAGRDGGAQSGATLLLLRFPTRSLQHAATRCSKRERASGRGADAAAEPGRAFGGRRELCAPPLVQQRARRALRSLFLQLALLPFP